MTAASSTTQKINVNSCTHEQVFEALACVDARLATATVKDNGPYKIAHPVCTSSAAGQRSILFFFI